MDKSSSTSLAVLIDIQFNEYFPIIHFHISDGFAKALYLLIFQQICTILSLAALSAQHILCKRDKYTFPAIPIVMVYVEVRNLWLIKNEKPVAVRDHLALVWNLSGSETDGQQNNQRMSRKQLLPL